MLSPTTSNSAVVIDARSNDMSDKNKMTTAIQVPTREDPRTQPPHANATHHRTTVDSTSCCVVDFSETTCVDDEQVSDEDMDRMLQRYSTTSATDSSSDSSTCSSASTCATSNVTNTIFGIIRNETDNDDPASSSSSSASSSNKNSNPVDNDEDVEFETAMQALATPFNTPVEDPHLDAAIEQYSALFELPPKDPCDCMVANNSSTHDTKTMDILINDDDDEEDENEFLQHILRDMAQEFSFDEHDVQNHPFDELPTDIVLGTADKERNANQATPIQHSNHLSPNTEPAPLCPDATTNTMEPIHAVNANPASLCLDATTNSTESIHAATTTNVAQVSHRITNSKEGNGVSSHIPSKEDGFHDDPTCGHSTPDGRAMVPRDSLIIKEEETHIEDDWPIRRSNWTEDDILSTTMSDDDSDDYNSDVVEDGCAALDGGSDGTDAIRSQRWWAAAMIVFVAMVIMGAGLPSLQERGTPVVGSLHVQQPRHSQVPSSSHHYHPIVRAIGDANLLSGSRY